MSAPALAQTPDADLGGIAVVDQDRLFEQSAYGQRVLGEIDQRTEALAAENSRISTELTAEERALTDRRSSMEVAPFRELARAFDEKVQRLREEQDAKERVLLRIQEEARQDFFARAAPILAELLRDRGASVLLDQRAVLSAVQDADITDDAVAAIDAAIGDGERP